MIFCLNGLGNASNVWQNKNLQMGMIAVWYTLGTEFESSSAFTALFPGGGVDEMEDGKTSKMTVNFVFGKGFE